MMIADEKQRRIIHSLFISLALSVFVIGFYFYYTTSKLYYFTLSSGSFFLLYAVDGIIMEQYVVRGMIVKKAEKRKYYSIMSISFTTSIVLFAI